MSTFGRNLVELRLARGISQIQLAKAVGLKQAALSHLENNRRTPSITVLRKLTTYFGVKADTLVNEDTEIVRVSERDTQPEQYAAHKAVIKAVAAGELLPAKSYKCDSCGNQAEQWHHPSYHPDDHLNVVPLCRKCHRQHHIATSTPALSPATHP